MKLASIFAYVVRGFAWLRVALRGCVWLCVVACGCMSREVGMPDTVRSHFSGRATGYDNNRRYLIPNFDEYYRIGVDTLVCSRAAPKVLDLGAGTGLSTLFLLERFPGAQVTLLDFSEEMLAVARERFEDNPDINYVVGDYRALSADEPSVGVLGGTLGGPFDIVISGLSIHHLSFIEKQMLTSTVFDLLAPAGEFLNADLVKCESEEQEQEIQTRLRAFLRLNLNEEQMQRFEDSQRIDIPITLSEHLAHMRVAGFRIADCLYRYWIYGVFYGQK